MTFHVKQQTLTKQQYLTKFRVTTPVTQ